MADYEHMADGYKAHLFQWNNEEPRHLTQCGCWICEYKRQERQVLLHREDEYEVSIWTLYETDLHYWGDSDESE